MFFLTLLMNSKRLFSVMENLASCCDTTVLPRNALFYLLKGKIPVIYYFLNLFIHNIMLIITLITCM
ncbi:hypothetical protein CKG00_12805 [Morganella morganii]|uniref:Uncharacterized protein n=1 Tax=Morganella morganii TaxID=582 RepID=A0A433ZYP8_MORMO|nr:hypothetical protein CKG00_12805 [Morganella morganii]